MDSVTQAALGAAIGQAGFRDLGRRAALFGALCGTLPDLDSVFAGGDAWSRLVVHRGLSHSLLVLPFLAIPVGWLGWRLMGKKGTPKQWMHLAFWALITHPLLDGCTTYGTQLLAPLSDFRFSWDTVGIIDLIYTLPLLVALGVGARKTCSLERARTWARGALLWGCLYLAGQWGVTQVSLSGFVEKIEAEGHEVVHARAPTPALFPMLRHGVAQLKDGRLVTGTLAPWAPERTRLDWITPDDTPLIREVLESEKGQIMLWFSDGFVSSQLQEDGSILFSDHRYGRFTDSTSSVFQFYLPVDGSAEDLTRRPRSQRKGSKMDIGAELRAGWSWVTGDP